VKVSGGASPCIVFGGMTAAADRADDDVVRQVTLLNQVSEFVAAVTLSNEGKRIKKFGFAWSAKHEDRVLSNAGKARPILIKEGEDNRRLLLWGFKRCTEPFRSRNNSEALEGIIVFKLTPQFLG